MTPERSLDARSCPQVKIYYDESIESVVRYRIDPPPPFYAPRSDGWGRAVNSISGLRLSVTDEAIEVRGFGPFRKLLEALSRMKLSLPTRETALETVRMGRVSIGPWAAPRPQADFLALSCKLANGVEYSLAIRPSDGDLDRLRAALRTAGAHDHEG
jgi:hypothetical protein